MRPYIKLADIAQALLPQLAQIGKPLALYAFGSRAHGQEHEDSDLDLAVLFAGYADTVQLWQIGSDLAALWHVDVDLLDLRAASTVMQYQILTTGERLWADAAADSFEAFIYSEKNWLDGQRAGLLADINASGSIYG